MTIIMKGGIRIKWKNFIQGFSNLSEVGARGLLNLGKKAFELSKLVNLMQSKRTEPPFEMD